MNLRQLLEGDIVDQALGLPEPAVGDDYASEKVKRYLEIINQALDAMRKKENNDENDAIVADLRDKKKKWSGVDKETKPVKVKQEEPPPEDDEKGEKPEEEPPPEEEEPSEEEEEADKEEEEEEEEDEAEREERAKDRKKEAEARRKEAQKKRMKEPTCQGCQREFTGRLDPHHMCPNCQKLMTPFEKRMRANEQSFSFDDWRDYVNDYYVTTNVSREKLFEIFKDFIYKLPKKYSNKKQVVQELRSRKIKFKPAELNAYLDGLDESRLENLVTMMNRAIRDWGGAM